MKRGKPLERRTPLVSTTPLVRRTPLRRVPFQRGAPTGKPAQRPAGDSKDAQWRQKVYALRGRWCRSCGESRPERIQVDHMIPRTPATRWEPCNGLPLCDDFGKGRCHPRKTAHQLAIQRDWLDPDQIEWLAQQGHAEWQPDGTVTGRHCRLFAPSTIGHGGPDE